MKYFHCPITFKAKPYGCGFGPVNGTVAFLDMGSMCRCGKALKPHTKAKAQKEYVKAEQREAVAFVSQMFGQEAADNYAKTKGIK